MHGILVSKVITKNKSSKKVHIFEEQINFIINSFPCITITLLLFLIFCIINKVKAFIQN